MANNPNHKDNLKVGGNVGNRGGYGRPTSMFREKCRGSLEDKFGVIGEIIDGWNSKDPRVKGSDVINALALLYKFSGLDVAKVAQVNAEGDDLNGETDQEALDALLKARMAEQAKAAA